MRDTCVFICFLWLCDVAGDTAKAGHPFWALAIVFLLLLAGFHYIEDISPAFADEDEDDEVSLDIDTVQALLDSGVEGEPRQLMSVDTNAFKALLLEFENKTEED